MSDEEQEDKDLEAMRQQIEEQEAREKSAKAATAVAEPEPQPPTPEAPAPVQAQTPETVTEPTVPETPSADDPMEWAKKKGLTSPESMARSLQSLEDEFHRRNQAGHPGYRDLGNGNPAPQAPPPPPNWQPRPDMGYPPVNGWGMPPPPPSRQQINQELSRETGIDPDDIERLMPLVVKVSSAVNARSNAEMQREMGELRRQAARSSEFVRLSQDPAFADPRVQKEMHEVLKDGSLFQRSGSPYEAAFQIALGNLARKQLQQGTIPESTSRNHPPTTAGGGNGSANTAPFKVTDAMISSWTMQEQDAYFKSNGRIIPKR